MKTLGYLISCEGRQLFMRDKADCSWAYLDDEYTVTELVAKPGEELVDAPSTDETQERLQLDKDILVIGNKEYGSKTCCFVPQYINKLLNINQNNTGKVLPLGVCIKVRTACAVNIYVAQCRVDGDKGRHIGRFPSAMLAHAAWQLAKANAIKCAVIKYRLEPSYRKDVEDALQLRAEMLQDDHANHRETFSL